jgi:hypothetical protein
METVISYEISIKYLPNQILGFLGDTNEYSSLLFTTPLRLTDLEDGGTKLFRNMFHIRHGVTLPYFVPILAHFKI